MVFVSNKRPACVSAFLAVMFAGLASWATPASADEEGAPAVAPLEPITVTARKSSETVADEELRQQVQTALHSDPYFFDAHVTVTVHDGVVTLEGMVLDFWDLRDAIRISHKVEGVKGVNDELELHISGSDG
ncbi:exported hypothetical protein [Burkholderiales bacterium]|nr:exported hypothetical protein [Burkholderiales bacterium]